MKNKKIIVSICIVLIFISIVMCFINKIDVTKYTISNEKIPEEFNGFKIVQLSDFHSQGYRNTTEDIINKVKDINPDIIVMTGDMVSWDIEDIEEVKILIKSLAELYPIYYIDGNHEHLAEILRPGKYVAFIEFMKELGVTTIKNDYIEIYKGDKSINLYGINLPLDGATGLYVNKFQLEKNYVEKTLPEANEEKFNILLAHTPTFIKQYSQWGADLVLCGHMHGGIVRIPFTNIGLLSPERTIFPKYAAGKFKVNGSIMIVNRGIGTSSFKLRLFNNPEITVITLKSK
ncbi:metallophosphoesterase [Clostridium sp. D43t1_170807_H7]|uniref:metallophosphoesterase n=1 Tax=Clostridium sp. D43t1_170807_H7 TaxID=2787140 RepID=UPI00189C10DC|nr:metallophosphoesterase [Clostridium sp. D43t1_170807_H7]